jgi:hypothetical protein
MDILDKQFFLKPVGKAGVMTTRWIMALPVFIW